MLGHEHLTAGQMCATLPHCHVECLVLYPMRFYTESPLCFIYDVSYLLCAFLRAKKNPSLAIAVDSHAKASEAPSGRQHRTGAKPEQTPEVALCGLAGRAAGLVSNGP